MDAHVDSIHCTSLHDGRVTTLASSLNKNNMVLKIQVEGRLILVDVCGVLHSTSSIDKVKGEGSLRFPSKRDGAYSGIDEYIPGAYVRNKLVHVAKRRRILKESREKRKKAVYEEEGDVEFVKEKSWKERDDELRKAAIEL